MAAKRRRTVSATKEDPFDPSFVRLESLIGPVSGHHGQGSTDSVPDPLLLAQTLEGSLVDDLVTSWATIGQTSVTSQAFIDTTTRLIFLLDIMSSSQIFRVSASNLIHTIANEHFKLLYRALYTQRPSSVIPPLKLIAQLAKFDGGFFADSTISSFDFSLNVLPKLLTPIKYPAGHKPKIESIHSNSIRHHFIDLLLSFLKLGSPQTISTILSQRKLIVPWLKNSTLDDPDQLIATCEIFIGIGFNSNIPKPIKTAFFSEWVLARILHIYTSASKYRPTDLPAFYESFIELCTRPHFGILFLDNGWYPPGSLDDNEKQKSYRVHNRVLLAFIKTLDLGTPHHLRLLLAILKSAPELVAPFTSSMSHKLETILTMDFIRLFTLFSGIICLPTPAILLDEDISLPFSPPVTTVVENIIPTPLTKSAIENGLRSGSELYQYLTTNILVQALQKLQKLTPLYKKHNWLSDITILQEEVFRKLPDISSIAAVVHKPKPSSTSFAVSKILHLYMEIFPAIIITSNIDLSTQLLKFATHEDPDAQISSARGEQQLLELRNILAVQSELPVASKFWNQLGSRDYSTFTYLLQLSMMIKNRELYMEISMLLDKITYTSYLFQQDLPVSPIYYLMEALEFVTTCSVSEVSSIWYVINEAVARCLRSPFKYIDRSRESKSLKKATSSFSPFLVALMEQWNYLVAAKKPAVGPTKTLYTILCRIIAAFCNAGEDREIAVSILSEGAEGNLGTWLKDQQRQILLVLNEKDNYEDSIPFALAIEKPVAFAETDEDNHGTLGLSISDLIQLARNDDNTIKVIARRIELEKIGLLEFFSLYRQTVKHFSAGTGLAGLAKISEYLVRFSDTVVKSLILRYTRSLQYWEFMLWRSGETDSKPVQASKLEFTKEFFKFVYSLVDYSADMKEQIGFLYEYIVSAIPILRKSSKRVKFFLAGFRLLNDNELLCLISDNVNHGKPKPCSQICAEALSVLLERSEPQALLSKVFLEIGSLVKLCFVSANGRLASSLTKLLNATTSLSVSGDLSYLGSVFGKRKSKLHALLCRLMIVCPEVSCYVVEFFSEQVQKLEDDGLFNYAAAVTTNLVTAYNSAQTFRIRDGMTVSDGARRIFRESIRRVDVKEIGSRFHVLQQISCTLSNSEDIHLFYEKVVKSSNKISAQRVSFTHQMLLNSNAADDILADSRRYMMSVIAKITRYLTESDNLSSLQRNVIRASGILLGECAEVFEFGRNANPPIEAAIERWLSDLDVMNFTRSLTYSVAHERDLEYVKFLQMIASSPRVVFLDYSPEEASHNSTEVLEIAVLQACMIHHLYFRNPKAHMDPYVATRLTMFYRGTCGLPDRLLLEVLYRLDSLMNLGNSVNFALYSFKYDLQKSSHSFCARLREGVEVTFSGRRLGSNIKAMSVLYGNYDRLTPGEGEKYISKKMFSQDSYSIYDPLFSLPAIMDMTFRQVVDLKILADNHCIGYVIVCLGQDGLLHSMARKILIQLIMMAENSRYKERELLRLLLYKIHYLLEDFDASGLGSVPFIFIAVFANLAAVLVNPGHFLYDQAVRYITQSPYIKVADVAQQMEIPLYRALIPSSNFDSCVRETNWMLQVLVMGLKGSIEMGLYERNYVFETVQTLENSPYAAESTKKLSRRLMSVGRQLSAGELEST